MRRSTVALAAAIAAALMVAAPASADVLDSIPAPTVVKSPENPSNSRTASIEFTGDEGNLFDCSVDSSLFQPCASALTLTNLLDGLHVVSIRQRTPAGDVSADSVTVAWDVDTVAPAAPTVRSNRSGITSSTSATITITGDGSSVLNCSVDGAPAEECDSPFALDGLADGTHTVSVTQIDAAGNRSSARSASWTVDATAPDAPIVSSNRSGLVNSNNALITFSGEYGASFRCKIDSEVAFTACGGSPKSLTGLADGDHSITVEQVDRAGNHSPSVTLSWQVDATAPAAPAVSVNRTGTTRYDDATVTFSGEADATFECSLNSETVGFCRSPFELNHLADGRMSLRIRQVDLAGNRSQWNTVEWTVATLIASKPPKISGAASTGVRIGSNLTASGESFTGSSGQAALAFSWQRCPVSGPAPCEDIQGANTRSYKVLPADGGSRLRFTATHWSTEDATAIALSAPTEVVLPDVVTLPKVTGIPGPDANVAYGRTVGASSLAWSGLPGGASFVYRWDRCSTSVTASCRAIPGASAATLVPGPFEVGKRVRLAVGAVVGSRTVWATSPVTPIIRVTAVNLTKPRISLLEGMTSPMATWPLTIGPGSWGFTWAGSLSYRWQVCSSVSTASCVAVGSSAKSWTPRANAVGKRVRLVETYTGHDGTRVSAASDMTSPVITFSG